MNEQTTKLQCGPNPAPADADLCGMLFDFYVTTTALLRQSSLDGAKVKVVVERIDRLMDDATDEAKRSPEWNLTEWLDSAYQEVQSLVEKLSKDVSGERPKSAE